MVTARLKRRQLDILEGSLFRNLILFTIPVILSNLIRAIGHSTMSTVLYLLAICGIRIGWSVLVFPHFNTLECIYLATPFSWVVAVTVTAAVGFTLLNRKAKFAAAKAAQ